MVTSGWWMVQSHQWGRAEWRSATTMFMVPYVMIAGTQLMLEWCVDNWVWTDQKVTSFWLCSKIVIQSTFPLPYGVILFSLISVFNIYAWLLPLGSIAVRSAYYGSGNGAILLDNVVCRGTESSLLNCSSNAIGQHNCDHSEDASVRCEGINILYVLICISIAIVCTHSVAFLQTSSVCHRHSFLSWLWLCIAKQEYLPKWLLCANHT